MKETKEEKIIKIFESAFSDFGKEMCKNGYSVQEKEVKEEEIYILFYVPQFQDIFFKLYMKKQDIETDKIPIIKGATPLNLEQNPYEKLDFSDENFLLGKIYEQISKLNSAEIVCYEKYGILVKDLLDFKGIYNINIKCTMKE